MKKKKDAEELKTLSIKLTNIVENIWNLYDKNIKYSKIFTKSKIGRYEAWCKDNKKLLEKDFSDLFKVM